MYFALKCIGFENEEKIKTIESEPEGIFMNKTKGCGKSVTSLQVKLYN